MESSHEDAVPVDENANAIETAHFIQGAAPPAPVEICQEHIKTQLHDIISDIEQQIIPDDEDEVTKEQEDAVKSLVEQELKLMQEEEAALAQMQPEDEGQPIFHTWRPKGKYETIKTAVKHEDINAIRVDDPKLTELPKPAVAAPLCTVPEEQSCQGDMQHMTNGLDDELAGFNLPAGIPLLARILPKDPAEVERKISLERLFTPATDSPDLTPTRNKKVFSSSAFYRPDHPTVEDQVDLAQRISHSLINVDNKTSRGQTMYIKRKKRSVRWIHQGPHGQPGLVEVHEPDSPQRTPGERGPMKLMMSSKQQQVDQVYQTSEMESPTGKGAALFAKRKKRMDNYIVDETSVQQSQKTSSFANQQTSMMSSSSASQSSSSMATHNEQMMVGGALTGPTNITYGTQGAAAGADVIYTAECKVVQRSHPPTPQFELPTSGSLMELSTDNKDKRKSFNLAAKGFGTYQNFYTPVHLGKAF